MEFQSPTVLLKIKPIVLKFRRLTSRRYLHDTHVHVAVKRTVNNRVIGVHVDYRKRISLLSAAPLQRIELPISSLIGTHKNGRDLIGKAVLGAKHPRAPSAGDSRVRWEKGCRGSARETWEYTLLCYAKRRFMVAIRRETPRPERLRFKPRPPAGPIILLYTRAMV